MRSSLERLADEILLQDGKVFLDRAVVNRGGRRIERDLLKRGREQKRRALNEVYSTLPEDTRAALRTRYRNYNPNRITGRMSWSEWLTAELDKIDGLSLQRTTGSDRPDREDRQRR